MYIYIYIYISIYIYVYRVNPDVNTYLTCRPAHLSLSVEAVYGATRNARDVDGHVERADDSVVAVDEAVLDVVERRVDKHLVAVPVKWAARVNRRATEV